MNLLKRNLLPFILGFFILLFFPAKAYIPPIKFFHYSTKEGLPSNQAEAVLVDNKGVLWIATHKGLSSFNGSLLKTYTHSEEDSTTIPSNTIYDLFEDDLGRIWIGTMTYGIAVYNRNTDNFTRFPDYEGQAKLRNINSVKQIIQDKEGHIWALTENGIKLLDEASGKFTHFLDGYWADCGMPLDNSRLILGGFDTGIIIYNWKTNTIERQFSPKGKGKDKIAHNSFFGMHGNDSLVWINGDFGNLYKYNISLGTLELIKIIIDGKLVESRLNSIYYDENGCVYMGGDNCGLLVYDDKKNISYSYQTIKGNPYSLNSLSITDFDKDEQGTIWLSTYFGGVSYFNEKYNSIEQFFCGPDSESLLSSCIVSSIIQDGSGNIWIGTDGGGVNLLQNDKGTFLYANEMNNFPNNAVTDLTLDNEGNAWASTWTGGFMKLTKRGNKINYEYPTCNKSEGKYLESLKGVFCDSQNRLWLANHFSPITIYDIGKDELFHIDNKGVYPKELFEIKVIVDYVEKNGFIWIATHEGIYKYGDNKLIGYFRNPDQPKSPNTNFYHFVFIDKQNRLFFGGDKGLLLYDEKADGFINFSIKHSLPKTIFSVEEDSSGNFWMSTDEGILKFNEKLGTKEIYDDGFDLSDNSFVYRSSYCCIEGKMFFGGLNGLIRFNTNNLSLNTIPPSISINDVQVFNNSIVSSKEYDLHKQISELDKITLQPHHNVFSIEYSALNYFGAEKNKYAYKLKGFMDDWLYVGNERKATFTNLSPGMYTFMVKGCNNDGIWNETGTSIEIIILPPWYKTWWFKLLLYMTITSMIVFAVYWRLKRVTIMNKMLEDKVDERTEELSKANEELHKQKDEIEEQNQQLSAQKNEIAIINSNLVDKSREIEQKNLELEHKNSELEELNTTKDKFFSIIAHDLRNPMNTLIGFADLLNDSFDKFPEEKKKRFINIITSSSKNLFALLENLLQWARSQSGRMNFEPEFLNINVLLKENISILNHQAKKKEIEILLSSEHQLHLTGDKNMLNAIVRNLLSNAIKFTPKGGNITINAKDNMDYTLTISVEDSGIGMTPKQLNNIFKIDSSRSEKGTYDESGTGLGLVLCKEFVDKHKGEIWAESEKGKGSKFHVKLPIN